MSIRTSSGLEPRYEVMRSLGRGAFSEVVLARDRQLDRSVVIKLLAKQDPEARARFRREAALLARVDHPAIVPLLDFDADAEPMRIVYPYSDAEPLDRVIAKHGPLPWPRAVGIARALAGALAAVHALGITHRDVKPQNVLLRDGDAPLLIDFGLGRATAEARLTRTGVVLGTPAYLAPELIAGDPSSARSDLYALGVTLYELLTGTNPFLDGSLAEVLNRQCNLRIAGLPALEPPAPSRLHGLVLRLLEKDPDRRPVDASAVLGELAAVEPAPSPASIGSQTIVLQRRPARVSPRGSAFALGLVVASLASLAYVVLRAPAAAPAPRAERAPAASALPTPGATSPDRAVAEMLDEAERVAALADAARATEPDDLQVLAAADVRRTREQVRKLGPVLDRYAALVRRASAYVGPEPERLFALEPFAYDVLDAALVVARHALWTELRTLTPILRGTRTIANMRALRAEIAGSSQPLAVQLLATAHGGMFDALCNESATTSVSPERAIEDARSAIKLLAPLVEPEPRRAADAALLEYLVLHERLVDGFVRLRSHAPTEARRLDAVRASIDAMRPLIALTPEVAERLRRAPATFASDRLLEKLFRACAWYADGVENPRPEREAALRAAVALIEAGGPRWAASRIAYTVFRADAGLLHRAASDLKNDAGWRAAISFMERLGKR